ncbi:hypothetical protein HDU97_000255 [Phlyctochytrium planicorne]|nr:hypothetical protein HDU97_000255 [Phlyctochytrium planicorne]
MIAFFEALLMLLGSSLTSPSPKHALSINGSIVPRSSMRPDIQGPYIHRREINSTNADHISFHNGTVLTGPINFYTIFYGKEWNDTDPRIPIVQDFLNNFAPTTWWNTVREYTTKTGVQAGTRVLSVWDTVIDPGSFGTNFTNGYDSQLPQSWPQIPPPPRSIPGFYSMARFEIIGYRSEYFRVIVQSPDACPACRPRKYFFGESPNGNVAGDSIVNLLAHQIAQVVTDPLYDAWYFNAGLQEESAVEIAGPCDWRFTGVPTNATGADAWNTIVGNRRYLLQDLWSVTNDSCVHESFDLNTYGLAPGQSVRQGDRLVSLSQRFAATFGDNCTISVRDLERNESLAFPFESTLAYNATPKCLLTLGKDGNVYITDSSFQQLWDTNITVIGNITAELPPAALSQTYPDLNASKIDLSSPSFRLEDDGTLALVNQFRRPLWLGNVKPNLTYFQFMSFENGGISSKGGGISSSNGTYILGLTKEKGLGIPSLWNTGALGSTDPYTAVLRPDGTIAIVSDDEHVEWWSGPLTVTKDANFSDLTGDVTEAGFFEVRKTSNNLLLWFTGLFGNKLPSKGVFTGSGVVLTSKAGCYLQVNGTGSLEVLSSENVTIWSSNTSVTSPGLLKVVDADGKESFSTSTTATGFNESICYPALTISPKNLEIKFVSTKSNKFEGATLWTSSSFADGATSASTIYQIYTTENLTRHFNIARSTPSTPFVNTNTNLNLNLNVNLHVNQLKHAFMH